MVSVLYKVHTYIIRVSLIAFWVNKSISVSLEKGWNGAQRITYKDGSVKVSVDDHI